MDTGLDPLGLVMLLLAMLMFVVLIGVASGGAHMYSHKDGRDPNYCYIHKTVDGRH